MMLCYVGDRYAIVCLCVCVCVCVCMGRREEGVAVVPDHNWLEFFL